MSGNRTNELFWNKIRYNLPLNISRRFKMVKIPHQVMIIRKGRRVIIPLTSKLGTCLI